MPDLNALRAAISGSLFRNTRGDSEDTVRQERARAQQPRLPPWIQNFHDEADADAIQARTRRTNRDGVRSTAEEQPERGAAVNQTPSSGVPWDFNPPIPHMPSMTYREADELRTALRECLDAHPPISGIENMVRDINAHAEQLGQSLCDELVRTCVRYVNTRAHEPVEAETPRRAIIRTNANSAGPTAVYIRISFNPAAPRGQSITTEVITQPGSPFRRILPIGHQEPNRAILASASLDGAERICHMAIRAACRVSQDMFPGNHRAYIYIVSTLPSNAVMMTGPSQRTIVSEWWLTLLVSLRNEYQETYRA